MSGGKDQKGRMGGGVGFLLGKGVEEWQSKAGLRELMWMEVEDGEGKLFLAVVSFPKIRETNRDLMGDLSVDIISFRERICIVRDLNSRIGELESRVSEEESERVYKRRSRDKRVD